MYALYVSVLYEDNVMDETVLKIHVKCLHGNAIVDMDW